MTTEAFHQTETLARGAAATVESDKAAIKAAAAAAEAARAAVDQAAATHPGRPRRHHARRS